MYKARERRCCVSWRRRVQGVVRPSYHTNVSDRVLVDGVGRQSRDRRRAGNASERHDDDDDEQQQQAAGATTTHAGGGVTTARRRARATGT